MTNTVTTLAGLFKERYADKLVDVVPEGSVLLEDIPFAKAEQQIGNVFHQPVVLTQEGGFTYSAAAQGAFSINSAIAATLKDAQVTGAQVLLESRIDYESAARAQEGGRAFEKVFDVVVRNMLKAFGKRCELAHLYGGISLGQLNADPGNQTTSYACVISEATWSAGIWAGMEGAQVDVYSNSSGLPNTIRNTAACTVAAVDNATRTVTLTCTTDELDNATTDDHIVFRGSKGADWTGFMKIAGNTSSLFGIDPASYSLWGGNAYSVGSVQLTMAKVLEALDTPVSRGLNENVNLYCSPRTWSDLMTDLAGLRRFDGSYSKKGKNGFDSIEFYAQSGSITVKPHRFMKDGQALILAPEHCHRLGATDVTFKVPGSSDDLVYQLPSNAGYGIRAYTFQASFCDMPASCVALSGITNS